jgi:hypothetical protein
VIASSDAEAGGEPGECGKRSRKDTAGEKVSSEEEEKERKAHSATEIAASRFQLAAPLKSSSR